MKKIKIQPSFILLAIIMIALGYPEQFFIMFLAVTMHEATHIAAALYFKLKFIKIIFTPIGEIAVIESAGAKFHKRFLITLAGPCVSALAAAVGMLIPGGEFFTAANIAICIFNLLPVYPLDGGRLIYMLLCLRTGNLKAGKFISKLAFVLSGFIAAAGLVQVVLYPYNISLLCLGIYLLKVNKREYTSLVFEFYKALEKINSTEGDLMPVRLYAADKDTPLKKIINEMSIEYYNILHIVHNGVSVCTMTQRQIMQYAAVKGISGTVGDASTF